jgi:excisionase family DNA binding protein
MTAAIAKQRPAPVRRYIDVVSASFYCGVSISTIRRWIQRRQVTAHRPGGSRRYVLDVRELDRMVRDGMKD